MKKFFCLLGLCSLALVACSVDETVQEGNTNAVKFKTTTAVRATATTTNNLESFSVWAWNGDIEFMDDVIATRSGSTFTTSPLYFWPTGTVDFYALTPSTTITAWETDDYGNQTEYAYIGGEITNEGDDEGTGWTYTGNVAKAKIANGDISLDVYVPGSYDDQIDLCYAVALEQSSGTVSMNFRHALSQIVFKAMNTNSDMVVDIKDISVCSVYKHGTYYLPTVSTTTNLPTDDLGTSGIAGSQGKWDANEDHKARFVAGITATTLEGLTTEAVTLTSDDGSLMLLPQEVEAWDPYGDATDTNLGAYIRINCAATEGGARIWPTESEADDDGVIPEYAEIAIPIDIVWEEGWRYTYTLIFGEGFGYYPPDDPNDDVPGTPVLVPISFDVSVDEFQSSDNTDVSTYIDTSDILPYLTDENFQAYVAANFDSNGNGLVSLTEAATVTSIRCGNYPNDEEYNYPDVKDFTGIEYFTGLTSFESNTAEVLDLSSNTELTAVYLGYYRTSSSSGVPSNASPITYLDLSANTKLTSLDNYAFNQCENLETFIFPSTITSIGNYCFSYCSALTNVALPDVLETMGSYAFQYCTSLSFVDDKLPDSLVSTDTNTFGNSGLEKIIWSSGAPTLPTFTFNRCTSLADVTLPETFTTVSTNAFVYCSALTNMTIYATTPPTIVGTPFNGAKKFDLYVPAESIEAYEESSWASYCKSESDGDDTIYHIYAIED